VEVRPGDQTDQTGEPRGDRDRVIETLKAAFVEGRLAKEEFDYRVGQALAAYAEIDALTADIAATPPAAKQAARRPAQQPDEPPLLTREAYNKRLVARGTFRGAGGIGLLAAIAMTAGTGNPFVGVMVGVVLGVFTAGVLAAFLTFLSWALEKNQGSQSTPPPSARAAKRLAAADQADQPGHAGHADQADQADQPGQPGQHRQVGPGQTAKGQWYAARALATQ
jgi:Domain of unknown function (DUF1707)